MLKFFRTMSYISCNLSENISVFYTKYSYYSYVSSYELGQKTHLS